MSVTYIIEAPNYDKNIGGVCALHYLADRLTHMGVAKVYITADILNPRWSAKSLSKNLPFFLSNDWVSRFYLLLTILKNHVYFETLKRKLSRLQKKIFPCLLWKYFDRETTFVIYPEIVHGNPLRAAHVIRWIMNTPGVCGGDGIYDMRDHIFQYHPWYTVSDRYKVQGLLTVIDLDYQLKTYQNKNLSNRKGGAFLVRKGREKKQDQHPSDFVHADPILEKMSDEEVANFLNSIKIFISYDDMSWISVQAALCGCESIIVPGQGDRSEENLKKVNRIKGVSYGFSDQVWVESTKDDLRSDFEALNAQNLATIVAFHNYCESWISSNITDIESC